MSAPEKYHAVFAPEQTYHVYNCTNNRELLFRSDENYAFFLRQYAKYITPYAHTFAYNLLPNHFHIVCSVKPMEEIVKHLTSVKPEDRLKVEIAFLETPDKLFDTFIEAQFHRFFTSYSMSFNKMFSRKGNLFQRAFKRVLIADEAQLFQTLVYVHANAVKHNMVTSLDAYGFTSYHSYLSGSPTMLLREYILNLFGGKEAFIHFHKEQTKYYYDDMGQMDD